MNFLLYQICTFKLIWMFLSSIMFRFPHSTHIPWSSQNIKKQEVAWSFTPGPQPCCLHSTVCVLRQPSVAGNHWTFCCHRLSLASHLMLSLTSWEQKNRRARHILHVHVSFLSSLLFASLPYILTPLPLPRGGCRTRKMFIWAGSSMLANCCNAAVLKIYKYILQYSNSGLTAVDFCLLAVLQQGRLLCMW